MNLDFWNVSNRSCTQNVFQQASRPYHRSNEFSCAVANWTTEWTNDHNSLPYTCKAFHLQTENKVSDYKYRVYGNTHQCGVGCAAGRAIIAWTCAHRTNICTVSRPSAPDCAGPAGGWRRTICCIAHKYVDAPIRWLARAWFQFWSSAKSLHANIWGLN